MKKNKPASVDEYIAALDGEPKERIVAIRKAIHKAFPKAEESIRYDMPAFCGNGIHIYFAAFKNHTGMYAAYALGELEEQIKPYRGKGTKDSLHFLYKEPLPVELIIKIARLKFNKKSSMK